MPDQKQSILLGALVTGVLSTSYLGFINLLCCAGIIAGAMVAVWHYTETNRLTLASGQGAVMGLLTALGGVVISFAFNYLLSLIGLDAEEAVQRWILDFYEGTLPPEQIDQIREQMEAGQSWGQRIFGGAVALVVASIFGAIGGAIGAAVFKKGGEEPAAEAF